MSLEIIYENKNPLFDRKEVALAYEAEKTPSKIEVIEMLADKFKAKKELIRLQKIEGKFGSNVFKITADIYGTQEEFNRLVKKTKKEIEDEKKAEEARKAAEEEARKKAEEEAKAKEEAAKAAAEEKNEGSEEKTEENEEGEKKE
jgi:ribosomal protein S24E